MLLTATGFNAMGITPDEIKNLWQIVGVGDESLLELRALWPSGLPNPKPPTTKHFYVPDYESKLECKEAFEATALKLNAIGYNIYIVMNPIRPTLTNGNAKDADIEYRDLLLVDIDRAGDKKKPANQAELDAAEALALKIRSYMHEHRWQEPIVVMSGNGYHLYYILDGLDNNDESISLIQTTLNNLAFLFDNETVEIDTVVYNASRITKVPGTIARKGLETEDRPYRMARVCHDF